MTGQMAGSSSAVSPKVRAIGVLTALVLASGVAGAAIDRMVVRSQHTIAMFDTTFHPLSSRMSPPQTMPAMPMASRTCGGLRIFTSRP